MSAPGTPVTELRVVLTARQYDATVRLLRDALHLPEVDAWDDPGGRGLVLDVGRATIEVIDAPQAERMDAIEAPGHRSGAARLALRVNDVPRVGARLAQHGATPLGAPVVTPWGHHSQRLVTPDGLHLTLYHPREDARPQREVMLP